MTSVGQSKKCGSSPPPCVMRQARGTTFCSSGIEERAVRQPVLDADEAQRGGADEDRAECRARPSPVRRLDGRGAPPTSSATFRAGTITASIPRRSSSTTCSRVTLFASAIASLPTGTSVSSSSARSRSSVARWNVSGSCSSSTRSSTSSLETLTTRSSPSSAACDASASSTVAVFVVLLGDHEARRRRRRAARPRASRRRARGSAAPSRRGCRRARRARRRPRRRRPRPSAPRPARRPRRSPRSRRPRRSPD